MVLGEPQLGRLLGDLRELLGYGGSSGGASGAPRPSADGLCEQLKAICATTRVGFFMWCSYGRVPRGRIPSLPECGEASTAHAKGGGPGSRSWEAAAAAVR